LLREMGPANIIPAVAAREREATAHPALFSQIEFWFDKFITRK